MAKFNFTGGNNDAEQLPLDALMAAAASVLARGPDARDLRARERPARLSAAAPLLVEKLKRTAGIACTAEEILVTSGSLQALDLVNGALLASGDTVLIEQESYQGLLNRLTRLGVNALGIPLDRDGMRVEAAAAALADLKRRGIHAKYIYTIPTVQNRPPPSCRSSDGSSS